MAVLLYSFAIGFLFFVAGGSVVGASMVGAGNALLACAVLRSG